MSTSHTDSLAPMDLMGACARKMNEKRDSVPVKWTDGKSTNEMLSIALRECVEKGDPVDVANYCAMLHARGEKIMPLPFNGEGIARDLSADEWETIAALRRGEAGVVTK